MLESLGQYLIDNYMANLRKELVVSGLCGANLAQVLAESHTHLIEAMETANPQNGLEAERVIREFGSSKLLAKRLSKEYRRKSAQRFLVWPPVVVMITMILMRCPLMNYIGHFATISMIAGGVALFLLGVRARRLVIIEFVALALGLTVFETIWYTATSYPVIHTSLRNMSYYEPVGRNQVKEETAFWTKRIAQSQEIIRQVGVGRQVFTARNTSQIVPAYLMYQGKYWLPEGVREVGIGVEPKDISPSLLVGTWKNAVSGWTQSSIGGSASNAATVGSEDIEYCRQSIHNLSLIQSKPLLFRAKETAWMVAPIAFSFSALAFIETNAGWVIWLLFESTFRVIRRKTYGPESRQGAII